MTQQLTSTPTRSKRLTYLDFLKASDLDPHVEWVNGEVVKMAPVSNEHQDVAGFLLALLRAFVDFHGLGVVRHDPFQMKTGADLPGRAPDIIYISKRNLSRLKQNHLQGPADLVIEIISPGSRGIDRGEKYHEYEQGGVREYGLIDPIRKQAEFYQRGRDDRFHPTQLSDAGVYRSAVLKGLWIEPEWLWKRPSVPEIWKRWKLV